eukprot:TRINITY_DN100_c0_g1_i2.p1 TRINITY_DN100_c0_g1~~TRINITY_DN100_c0_g1_i2.p1  ORF type:complete len:467 (+),score=53.65 TRINITY_DN100_c0_g1_i2:118-1518(+)
MSLVVLASSRPINGHSVCKQQISKVSVPKQNIPMLASFVGASIAFPLAASAEFSVPPLTYPYESLEPTIDTQTMQLHHDKHHAAYVAKLNDAVKAAPELASKNLVEIVEGVGTGVVPESVKTTVRNNGGGHWNHSFFWNIMKPGSTRDEITLRSESTRLNSSHGNLPTSSSQSLTITRIYQGKQLPISNPTQQICKMSYSCTTVNRSSTVTVVCQQIKPKVVAPKVGVPLVASYIASSIALPLAASAEFSVPALSYPYESLEPYIDTQTMQLHHDKHHAAYVGKLNDAVKAAPELASKNLVEIVEGVGSGVVPDSVKTTVRNNGGGHWNHSFFWNIMKAGSSRDEISPELLEAINTAFGSVDEMISKVNAAGAGQFGSGWAWVIMKETGDGLAVTSTPNQDSPLMKGIVATPGIPILGVDVWEHAYYLKYQNRRPEYLTQWWNVVNWDQVSKNYANAKENKVLGPQ